MVRRGEHNRLGFALQLCTVRFLGTFLPNPTEVPPGAVSYVSRQLEITNPECLSRYVEREPTHREHAGEIQKHYGYRDFSDQPEHWRLVRWLYERSWVGAESPSVLFDLVTARLVENKVLLPGVTVLEKLVARVGQRANKRLWHVLAKIPTLEQRQRLETLVVPSETTWYTPLEQWRRSPTRFSAPALVDALNRLASIRSLGVGHLDVSKIPPNRLKVLSRTALTARAQAIARMPEQRRLATLLAFVHVMEANATDDALDILELLVKDLLSSSAREGKKERLRTLRDLDAAALQLSVACKVLLNPDCHDPEVRDWVFQRISQDSLAAAIAQVEELSRPPEDNCYQELLGRWRQVRRFLPTLLRTVDFQANKAGQPVLAALGFLKTIEGRTKPKMNGAPLEVITKGWTRWVIQANGELDRRAYTFCVLEQLVEGLRRRDLFVTPSVRWSNPQAKLLQGQAWESKRPHVCRVLNLQPTPEKELQQLGRQLEQAYQRTASNLPTNAAVRVEVENGRETLTITNLDKLEEPASYLHLKERVEALLPRVDLPEVLLEIQAKTGFMDEFTHISDVDARIADFPTSICAVLIALACNIGIKPLVSPDVPALTRSRLFWIEQNYLRPETLIRANARLVDVHRSIPLASSWGGGEVASADGLRFVVPVRTLNAGPNSKYFGRGRGITYYNFTSDQKERFSRSGGARDIEGFSSGLGRVARAKDQGSDPEN